MAKWQGRLGKGLLRGTRVMAWFVTRSRGELRMHSRLNNLLLTFPNEPNQAGLTPTRTTENQQDRLLGADF